ncbi:P-loop containing nucleoside triphosphate hydrolase protein, partial [Dichotomocladium elegans]
VNVEFCRNISDCASVHVEPYTEDDWEILELHAGYVEENLLSQIRAIYTNQLMCVWIHGRTLVRLRVADLDPKGAVLKLTTNSEVIVSPKIRKQPKQLAEQAASLIKEQKSTPHLCLRILPISSLLEHEEIAVIHPDTAGDLTGSELVRLSKVVPEFARQKGASNNNEDVATGNESAIGDASRSKALYIPFDLSKSVPRNHIYVGKSARMTLDLNDFDIVKVATVITKSNPSVSVILRHFVSPTATNTSSIRLGLDSNAQVQAQQKAERDTAIIQAFRDRLLSSASEKLIINNGSIYQLSPSSLESSKFLIQFGQKKGLFSGLNGNVPRPDSGAEQYTIIKKSQLKDLQIEVGEDALHQVSEDTSKTNGQTYEQAPVMGGVGPIYAQIRQYTLANLARKELKDSLSVPGCGGILVTGAHGAGKTSLVRKLIQDLRSDPTALIYTREVNCAEIADERVPTFKDLLQQWFDEAAWHAPSLIFLNDIDRLVPAEVEHADSTRSRHLAELFLRMALHMTKRHPIMIIATSQQQQSLHPVLTANHVFTELKHLNPPTRDERKEIMETIMSNGPAVLQRSLPRIDLVAVASETEGYLAADLKALIERTVHEGAVRSIKDRRPEDQEKSEELQLTQIDFTKAREDFVPSSLRGVKLQSSGVMWSDIGGLNETRRALLETLEWPTKYAAVFCQSPLRLRSGVKGPEILNKYIGASEKSVRDLFERAQAAKPCVLFFDEFDSIAPRRGHDSTGVTDRVVNQMLTQMDGAEGLDGVYVLAATSRPDLIDPALLRPGRLDKSLLCGMPDLEERLEILQALSRKMVLAQDVDLRKFAEKTEGFSGADLQGFLYNAHLEAIHGAINIETFKDQQKKEKKTKQQEASTNDFVMVRPQTPATGQKAIAPPLTLAEKGQISQRLALIKKSVLASASQHRSSVAKDPINPNVTATHAAVITTANLEKSLKGTRASITAEEYMRLSMIYNEFVTGRTGELPSGEGAKGIGKRTTLG